MSVFRFYARTLSSIYEMLPYAFACPHYREIQIVLDFARDYNYLVDYEEGKFSPYFSNITPQDIIDIKKGATVPGSVKFFLSIGGRDPSCCYRRFPFVVDSKEKSKIWIRNAIESLTTILQGYRIGHDHLIDGIDVYYEQINADALPYFSSSIASVIANLKGGDNAIVTQASITVSDPLKETYKELFKQCGALIDNVVYQCFTLTRPDQLLDVFRNLPYPKNIIFAGYSDWAGDQTNVTLDMFSLALPQLLNDGLILALSMWHGNPGH